MRHNDTGRRIQKLVVILIALGALLQAACALSTGSPGGLSGPAAAVATLTPPPIGTPVTSLPSSAPQSPAGAPGISPRLSGTPAFTTADMAQYVTSHPIPGAAGRGAPANIRNAFLPSEVVSGFLGHTPLLRPAGTLLGYVELRGGFTFPGADAVPLTYPSAYEVFDARSGNLVAYGGLRGPTPTASPTVSPTPSPTPKATPPQLSVSPTGEVNVVCGALPLTYPAVTVRNGGGGTLTWSVTATNAHVTVSPAGGSLGAGQARTLTTGQASGGAGTDLNFTSNGGSAKVSFVCQVG